MKKSFNIQELFALQVQARVMEPKPMHPYFLLKSFPKRPRPNIMEPSPCTPSSSRAFQRDQEHDLKHLGLMDLISTKQNIIAPTSAPFTRCQL
jgi:hypothetical protein